MRKFLLLLAFAATTITMSSCEKDNEDSQTTESRLKGVWTYVKSDYTEFVNGVTDSYTETASAGDYLDFQNNGTLVTRIDGDDDTLGWRVDGNDRLYIKDNFDSTETLAEIRTLTNDEMVLYSKESIGANYFESTVYLNR